MADDNNNGLLTQAATQHGTNPGAGAQADEDNQLGGPGEREDPIPAQTIPTPSTNTSDDFTLIGGAGAGYTPSSHLSGVRAGILDAAQSEDPIGALLPEQVNTFRLALRATLADRTQANQWKPPDLTGWNPQYGMSTPHRPSHPYDPGQGNPYNEPGMPDPVGNQHDRPWDTYTPGMNNPMPWYDLTNPTSWDDVVGGASTWFAETFTAENIAKMGISAALSYYLGPLWSLLKMGYNYAKGKAEDFEEFISWSNWMNIDDDAGGGGEDRDEESALSALEGMMMDIYEAGGEEGLANFMKEFRRRAINQLKINKNFDIWWFMNDSMRFAMEYMRTLPR